MTFSGSPRYSCKFYRPGVYRVIKFKRGLTVRVPVRRGESQTSNEEKFSQSLARSRRVVLELGLCNDWDYFFTGTLDEKKVGDRGDLSIWKRIAQFFRDFNKYYDCHIQYVVVPERHKDGSWHFHGLIRGIPQRFITRFVPGIHPWKLVKAGYLNFPPFARRFGFCSLGEVKSSVKVAFYVCKYLQKDASRNVVEFGSHIYYCSVGLKRSLSLGYCYVGNAYFDGIAVNDGAFCATGFDFGGSWSDYLPYLVAPVDVLPLLDWEVEEPEPEYKQLNIAGWCSGSISLSS